MAQGDSIGGIFEGSVDGAGLFILKPPIGEVWIITFINWSDYTRTGLVTESHRINLSGTLRNNTNVKIFVDNSCWIQFYFDYGSENRWAQWSGVQFK